MRTIYNTLHYTSPDYCPDLPNMLMLVAQSQSQSVDLIARCPFFHLCTVSRFMMPSVLKSVQILKDVLCLPNRQTKTAENALAFSQLRRFGCYDKEYPRK